MRVGDGPRNGKDGRRKMGKKRSKAKVQIDWCSRSHVVLKLHKSVLARLVASYRDSEGNWEYDTPIPLGAIEGIMENPKLANGGRFFWNHPRSRGPGSPGLTLSLASNRLKTPRLRPISGVSTP